MTTPASAQHYARVLRATRAGLALTQAQVADAIGVHVATISRFESGEREPRLGQMIALAKALQCSAHDFLPKETAGATGATES